METSLACVIKACNFNPSILVPGGTGSEARLIRANCYNGSLRLMLGKKAVNCGKGGFVSELEKKSRNEIMSEEELMGFGRLRENCKEKVNNGGIAELLECLEREAIMGEDEGKEPTDYNRRAQIFEQSSRVFQALKETTTTS